MALLHPFVEGSEEQGEPSKGDEDRDVKHEQLVDAYAQLFMVLGGSRDLMETEPAGFQCGDDHLMLTITTLRGDAVNIDIIDVHGANLSAAVMGGASHRSRAKSRPVPVMRTTCFSASVQT